MALRIEPKFTKADVKKMVAEKAAKIVQVIALNLAKIGEEFINNARNNGAYTDRTGNLRSSTGYIILYNGDQIAGSDFKPVIGKEKNADLKKKREAISSFKAGNKTAAILKEDIEKQIAQGSETGKKLIEEMAAKFPQGFVLIGVAGMNYAAAVEANGYDVITSSSITVETDLKAAFDRIRRKTS